MRQSHHRAVALVMVATAIVVVPSLLPAPSVDTDAAIGFHLLGGAILGGAYATAMPADTDQRWILGVSVLGAVIVVLLIECLQLVVPGRHFELQDIGAGVGGAVLGAVLRLGAVSENW